MLPEWQFCHVRYAMRQTCEIGKPASSVGQRGLISGMPRHGAPEGDFQMPPESRPAHMIANHLHDRARQRLSGLKGLLATTVTCSRQLILTRCSCFALTLTS